jgi:L-rhamnose mutarotase
MQHSRLYDHDFPATLYRYEQGGLIRCPCIDSIFYDDQSHILFASFKYIGSDYSGDMEKMAANPRVREWWKMTDAWQESLVPEAVSSEAGEPSWWKPVEEVFYQP